MFTGRMDPGHASPAIKMHRRVALAGLAGCCLAGARSAWAIREPDPVVPIQLLCNKLLETLRLSASTAVGQRFALLAPVVEAALNIEAILQASVGLSWTMLSADDQLRLLAAFRRYTTVVYLSNFNRYSGQRFEVSPDVQEVRPGEMIVETRLIPASGSPRLINYVMHRSGSSWKAVDVLSDGAISRVAVQRSDWRSILARGGPAALLSLLDRRTDTLLQ
jgi:phospholipid transport system substrate-binding protein